MHPGFLPGLFFFLFFFGAQFWLVKWPRHLGAGLLSSTKKKKRSVECCADSQKVVLCLKAEEGCVCGGGGRSRGGGRGLCKTLDCIQGLCLPNVPSCPQPEHLAPGHVGLLLRCLVVVVGAYFILSTKFPLFRQRSLFR